MKQEDKKITPDEAREKIYNIIKDIDIATLITRGIDGKLHGRPMSTQDPKSDATKHGELWFMTYNDSPKIAEIGADSEVMLAYAKPGDNAFVNVYGRAEVVQDRARIRQFWHEPYYTFFPKGPDDPRITLIRVSAERAEFWESPSSVIFFAYGYVAAKLTGKEAELGSHARATYN